MKENQIYFRPFKGVDDEWVRYSDVKELEAKLKEAVAGLKEIQKADHLAFGGHVVRTSLRSTEPVTEFATNVLRSLEDD